MLQKLYGAAAGTAAQCSCLQMFWDSGASQCDAGIRSGRAGWQPPLGDQSSGSQQCGHGGSSSGSSGSTEAADAANGRWYDLGQINL